MASDYTDILYDKADGIAWVTIDRQEVRNAFRPRTVDEMIDAFRDAWHDDNVGVVVLTGAGDKAFCSGGDQKQRGHGGYNDESGTPRLQVLELHRTIRVIPNRSSPPSTDTQSAEAMSFTFSATSPSPARTPFLVSRGPRWARSTPVSAPSSSRASLGRRRRERSGTCAVSTRRRRRCRWASSTPSSRSISCATSASSGRTRCWTRARPPCGS